MATAASARARGVAWENEVARYVGGERARVFHPDMGDVTSLRNTVVEAKAQGKYEIQEWLKQLRRQMDNAQAGLGLLAIKQKGKLSAKDGIWLIEAQSVPFVIELVQAQYHFRQRELMKFRENSF